MFVGNAVRQRAVREGVDNSELVTALVRGDADAGATLIDRFGSDVERLIAGAMGLDPDVPDIIQDVFVRIVERIHQLRDPSALRAWIASIAVFALRGHLRRRRRWSWIRFLSPDDIPETSGPTFDPESRMLLRATYRLLDKLPDNERLPFSLRFIAQLELTDVAQACGVSLATIKRRIARAEIHFLKEAKQDPMLRERIERSGRWKNKWIRPPG